MRRTTSTGIFDIPSLRAARTGSRPGAVAVAGLSCLVLATPAAGQLLRGVVRDAQSAEPVPLAYVALMAPGETVVAAALSERDGEFSLEAPSAGSYFMYVTRTGYRSLMDGLFELGEGGVMDLQVGLRPAPVPVDSITVGVAGGVQDLHSVGFYERQAMGFGRFIERDRIERTAVAYLTDAFHEVPRLVVVPPRPTPGRPTGLLNPEVRIRNAAGVCSPTLYVDGLLVTFGSRDGRGEAVRPDDHVDPSRVEAVEVYAGPAQRPFGYQATAGCGVILVWTRMGRYGR